MRLSLYHTECNHIIKAVHRLHIADLIPSKCRLNMVKNKQNFLESTQNPSTVVDKHTPPLVAWVSFGHNLFPKIKNLDAQLLEKEIQVNAIISAHMVLENFSFSFGKWSEYCATRLLDETNVVRFYSITATKKVIAPSMDKAHMRQIARTAGVALSIGTGKLVLCGENIPGKAVVTRGLCWTCAAYRRVPSRWNRLHKNAV